MSGPRLLDGVRLHYPEYLMELSGVALLMVVRCVIGVVLEYGLNDSPAGLAAYLGEKWHSWSDVTPADDFLCATFTLYWITQSITSSMRDYWDNRWHPVAPSYVNTPTAFGVFAHETVPEEELPRSYLERLYNIQRWTVFPRGGHVAPAEEPAAVAADLTAFFRGLG
jgi:pimeloyl-ACP methyl ester carboxylesterase